MASYTLTRETTVPVPLEEVFEFFSNPRNLEAITPPWLRFRIVTPQPIHMGEGTRIQYRLYLWGVPITWVSEITLWEPPFRFVDTQIRGPYQKWVHEHRFERIQGSTGVMDSVEYQVPGGYLVNKLLVRPDVERIFKYREKRLGEIFGNETGV